MQRRGAPSGGVPRNVIVIAAGEMPPALPPKVDGAYVIAADGGLDRARQRGLRVHEAVGDFDSIASEILAQAEADGVRVERHPTAKNETDLELALHAAMRHQPERIDVLGIGGGDTGHFLANMLLLAHPNFAGVDVIAHLPDATAYVIRGGAPGDAQEGPRGISLTGRLGQIVTLLPLHGDAHGIRTTGLRYALDGESLTVGSTRGVSNVFAGTSARVHLDQGVLLAVVRSPLSI